MFEICLLIITMNLEWQLIIPLCHVSDILHFIYQFCTFTKLNFYIESLREDNSNLTWPISYNKT